MKSFGEAQDDLPFVLPRLKSFSEVQDDLPFVLRNPKIQGPRSRTLRS